LGVPYYLENSEYGCLKEASRYSDKLFHQHFRKHAIGEESAILSRILSSSSHFILNSIYVCRATKQKWTLISLCIIRCRSPRNYQADRTEGGGVLGGQKEFNSRLQYHLLMDDM